MKKILFFLLIAQFTSCKEDSVTAQVDAIAGGMSQSAKEGNGTIQLVCGAQTLSVEGKCGGVTTMGELVITIQDKIVPSRVFTLSFNTDQFPTDGDVFAVKKSNYTAEGKKSEKELYIGFSEVSTSNQMDWSSDDASGFLKFEVDGDAIKCVFKDLELKPSEVYNKGELNQNAVVSGSFHLYRN